MLRHALGGILNIYSKGFFLRMIDKPTLLSLCSRCCNDESDRLTQNIDRLTFPRPLILDLGHFDIYQRCINDVVRSIGFGAVQYSDNSSRNGVSTGEICREGNGIYPDYLVIPYSLLSDFADRSIYLFVKLDACDLSSPNLEDILISCSKERSCMGIIVGDGRIPVAVENAETIRQIDNDMPVIACANIENIEQFCTVIKAGANLIQMDYSTIYLRWLFAQTINLAILEYFRDWGIRSLPWHLSFLSNKREMQKNPSKTE